MTHKQTDESGNTRFHREPPRGGISGKQPLYQAAKTPEFLSLDGEPVTFQVQSGHLVFLDASLPEDIQECNCIEKYRFDRIKPENIRAKLVELEAETFPFAGGVLLGYYEIRDFTPGLYTLKPEDIQKYTPAQNDEHEFPPEAREKTITVFDVDTSQFFVIDVLYLAELVRRHRYEGMFLPEERVSKAGYLNLNYFRNLAKNMGGPYFAYINAPETGEGFAFEGAGTYTLEQGKISR